MLWALAGSAQVAALGCSAAQEWLFGKSNLVGNSYIVPQNPACTVWTGNGSGQHTTQAESITASQHRPYVADQQSEYSLRHTLLVQ